MNLITLDFETYYDKDYSLRKLTTEEYIRDYRFEVIGVGVKLNNGETEWASGTRDELADYLAHYDWANSMLLAHNTMFDGAILNWHFGIKPKVYADTLCMSRVAFGIEVSNSLRAVAERCGVGHKGTEVLNAVGKRRYDFTPEELGRYGDYCVNDVDITYGVFKHIGKSFPRKELKLIDLTLRMFVDPVLELDLPLLELHQGNIKKRKENLLREAGVDKENLMSNPKFAELLESCGVKPPTKISPTTGKETWAFAKSDEDFKALEEHEDSQVQALVNARLGTKSTLEETRTQRFIDIANRGVLPVPVRYYAAHTGRWGGDDKINLQNLPSRGPDAKALKRSIIAPKNMTLIESDSSQIEARVLAWVAGQQDLVDDFREGRDVYKKMAAAIYNVDVDKVTKEQRFVGKTTILGAGYGMGARKFQAQLGSFGQAIVIEEARHIIQTYRDTNYKVHTLWQEAQEMLRKMGNLEEYEFGNNKMLRSKDHLLYIPSGRWISYDGLTWEQEESRVRYAYKTRRGITNIYGGKVTENLCQAIARDIIGEQMLKISKRYRVLLTVHDSILCLVNDSEVDEARAYIEECMRWVPDWAEGLPVNCESGIGKNYGDCE